MKIVLRERKRFKNAYTCNNNVESPDVQMIASSDDEPPRGLTNNVVSEQV